MEGHMDKRSSSMRRSATINGKPKKQKSSEPLSAAQTPCYLLFGNDDAITFSLSPHCVRWNYTI